MAVLRSPPTASQSDSKALVSASSGLNPSYGFTGPRTPPIKAIPFIKEISFAFIDSLSCMIPIKIDCPDLFLEQTKQLKAKPIPSDHPCQPYQSYISRLHSYLWSLFLFLGVFAEIHEISHQQKLVRLLEHCRNLKLYA